MWLAFPASDYYDPSDIVIRHRWTAHLIIRITTSHVHENGLCEVT